MELHLPLELRWPEIVGAWLDGVVTEVWDIKSRSTTETMRSNSDG